MRTIAKIRRFLHQGTIFKQEEYESEEKSEEKWLIKSKS
jgi:hypothetical protein